MKSSSPTEPVGNPAEMDRPEIYERDGWWWFYNPGPKDGSGQHYDETNVKLEPALSAALSAHIAERYVPLPDGQLSEHFERILKSFEDTVRTDVANQIQGGNRSSEVTRVIFTRQLVELFTPRQAQKQEAA